MNKDALGMSSGTIARAFLAFMFFYHGLVPKILHPSPLELEMIQAHGSELPFEELSIIAGLMEILLATAIVVFRQAVWPLMLALVALVVLLMDVAIFVPALLFEAFNPVTTNLAGIGLCLIAIKENRRQNKETVQ